jgi:hypothetical protein
VGPEEELGVALESFSTNSAGRLGDILPMFEFVRQTRQLGDWAILQCACGWKIFLLSRRENQVSQSGAASGSAVSNFRSLLSGSSSLSRLSARAVVDGLSVHLRLAMRRHMALKSALTVHDLRAADSSGGISRINHQLRIPYNRLVIVAGVVRNDYYTVVFSQAV